MVLYNGEACIFAVGGVYKGGGATWFLWFTK